MPKLVGKRLAAACAVSLLVLASVPLRADFPTKAEGYVTDAAQVLDAASFQDLDARVKATEQKTSAEIAVVTVSSLDGMTVEDYANRLFKEWGIGKRGRDNGVLVLVAPNDRKIRIEVGYGLEGVLPDGLAGDIIRNQAIPAFKEGDYNKGIVAAVYRVADIVDANETVTAAERERYDRLARTADYAPTWITTPFFGLFIAIGWFLLGLGLRTKSGFFAIFGSGFGIVPFLVALLPALNTLKIVLLPLAAGMFILGWTKGGQKSWRAFSRSGGGNDSSAARSTGWVMGASRSSGGSSHSSSSSSSSGSFGGGSSGGGGASGSW